MVSAVIVAAGSGTRAKLDFNKVFYEIGGITVLERTLRVFDGAKEVGEIVVAAAESDLEKAEKIAAKLNKPTKVVKGGKTRTESVKNALAVVSGEIVLIHDGARPYLTENLISRAAVGAQKNGSAIAAVPSPDTVADVKGDEIIKTSREGKYLIQTPQAFRSEEIKRAYAKIADGDSYTDDSSVYSAFIGAPHVIEGERKNVKLTYPSDFEQPYRVGVGFDLHRLTEGRKLILGGITIPHDKGLLGHSDADVLTHAIMDALLSALSLRDIGYHFPDTDPAYKGANSIELLEKVLKMVENAGYCVGNIAAVIMAEKPKLMPFVPEISTNLAKVIHLSTSNVGITCTTLEKVGTVGREEAVAAECHALLFKLP